MDKSLIIVITIIVAVIIIAIVIKILRNKYGVSVGTTGAKSSTKKENNTKELPEKAKALPLLFKDVTEVDISGIDENWKVYLNVFKSCSKYRFDSYVIATYKDMRLKRADVVIKRDVAGSRKTKEIFNGSFNEFTFRNTLSQEILVISKSYMGTLMGARSSETSFTDQIGFKDNPLAVHYAIFTANNDSAVRLLTRDFFEAVQRIERALDTGVIIHILGRRMLIAINNEDEHFNPAYIQRLNPSSKACKELYLDFKRLLNTIDIVRDKFPTLPANDTKSVSGDTGVKVMTASRIRNRDSRRK